MREPPPVPRPDPLEDRPRHPGGRQMDHEHERAKAAFAVIQTGERRLYGCFALRKGVIPPDV